MNQEFSLVIIQDPLINFLYINFKKLKSKIALISLDSIHNHKRYLYMHTINIIQIK